MSRTLVTRLFATSCIATAIVAAVGLVISGLALVPTSPAAEALAAFRLPAALAALSYLGATCVTQFTIATTLRRGGLPRRLTLFGSVGHFGVAAVAWGCMLRGTPSRALFAGLDTVVAAVAAIATLVLVVNWLALFAAELPVHEGDAGQNRRRRVSLHALLFIACALTLASWLTLESRPLPMPTVFDPATGATRNMRGSPTAVLSPTADGATFCHSPNAQGVDVQSAQRSDPS